MQRKYNILYTGQGILFFPLPANLKQCVLSSNLGCTHDAAGAFIKTAQGINVTCTWDLHHFLSLLGPNSVNNPSTQMIICLLLLSHFTHVRSFTKTVLLSSKFFSLNNLAKFIVLPDFHCT